jgi:processive 1,2-diacylglycerol beta-glucosyltransferase
VSRDYFERERPDLVVSLMPFVNDVFVRALADGLAPFGLVLTDLMDTEPFMWLTPSACATARFVAVGCAGAAGAARSAGVDDARLVTSGLVIHPKYFSAGLRDLTREQARAQFGLDPSMFTVLVVMGGYGGPVIPRIVRDLELAGRPWQVIACVGRNDALQRRLDAMRPTLRNRLVVFGFTRELHLLMRAANVVVTKPGPASIFECLTVGTPLVVDDECTMPQEAPNAAFLVDNGLGLAVAKRAQIVETLRTLADGNGRLASLEQRIGNYNAGNAAHAVIEAMSRAMKP